MKKRYYLIGNAHLDPVWLWRWTEGVEMVKQTVAAALDRMEETDDFVFTSSQAVTYKWLAECNPELLEKVRKRVAEGRWIICGGQYVQPDCNTPSGESFARNALYSQRLFEKLLGTRAKTAYNVDSFGHNAMLPQIYVKSGMNQYVFQRPAAHEKTLPANVFLWRSPDGTQIPAFRIPNGYGRYFETAEQMKKELADAADAANRELDCTMLFYGVGNHGGGPTKKNLAAVKVLQKELAGTVELYMCGPEAFFDDIRKSGARLPVVDDDLQHHASGCYSAVSELKRLNRRLEADLYLAETFAAAAHVKTGLPFPGDRLEQAWENVLFNQFHDSMGGCAVEKVYEDAYAFAGESTAIASRITSNSIHALSWAVDTSDLDGVPVMVFNPHPWPVRVPVVINYRSDSLRNVKGEDIPFQHVHSQAESCHARGDVLFLADVPAMGYATYLAGDKKEEPIMSSHFGGGKPGEFVSTVSATPSTVPPRAGRAAGPVLENEYLRVEFASDFGAVRSMTDKETGEELLSSPGAVPLVIDEYDHDTWSHNMNYFDRVIGRFSDAKCTVLETGPVRATVKVESFYNQSSLTQYFSLVAEERMLRVRGVCDWREKHKMLKISWPCEVGDPLDASYEIPFGHFERPCDGEEENGHRYVILRGDRRSMAMLNDSKYSFSILKNDMRLTVLRSPIYADHGGPRTDESEFTEQGVFSFLYTMLPCGKGADYSEVERRAAELNCPPDYVCGNSHKGSLPFEDSFCSIEGEGVDLTAFKRAEDGNGWVVRLYETTGCEREILLHIPLLQKDLKLHFGKFEIRTLLLPDDGSDAREVMITEWDYD